MPNNTVPISFNLKGLIKRLNYSFTVEGLGGNWPATATPGSGSFTAVSKSGQISGAVSFCATTGSCLGDTEILPYDMAKACTFDQSEVYTFVRMRAQADDDPEIYVYSDPIYVKCNSCLPNAKITIPPLVSLNRNTGNSSEFMVNITGLVPKESYVFNFSSIEANWPVKIYPISGTILSANDTYNLPCKAIFCNATGVCGEQSENVLDYTVDPVCLTQSYFSSIKLHLEPESCEYDGADSNVMNMKCESCLPIPLAVIPGQLNLTHETNNFAEFVGLVTGIIPNRQYAYEFRALDANWPIYLENTTGVFSSPTTTYCIEAYAEFCSNTGVCVSGSHNVLDFTIPANCFRQNNNHEARLILDISSTDCDQPLVSSNIMHFSCDDCFPESVRLSTPATQLNLNAGEDTDLIIDVSNIEPNKLYTYSIESEFSNWPIFAYKASGYIQSPTSSYRLVTNVAFCESSLICPSGYKGVLNYALENDNIPDQYETTFKKYAILRMVLSDADCPSRTFTSKKIFVECNNCQGNQGVSLSSVNITG